MDLSGLFESLPVEIVQLIFSKLSPHDAYKLLSVKCCRDIQLPLFLKNGKKLLATMEAYWIHPDSDYKPAPANTEFTELDAITRQLWNAYISVDKQLTPEFAQLEQDVFEFLTMQCEQPASYNQICDDMWIDIIRLALDTEYDPVMDVVGGYKKYKYINAAIDRFNGIYGLDTPEKEIYGLFALIKTYHDYKDEIYRLYGDGAISTPLLFYGELKSLIAQVSYPTASESKGMISQEFLNSTFNFMCD